MAVSYFVWHDQFGWRECSHLHPHWRDAVFCLRRVAYAEAVKRWKKKVGRPKRLPKGQDRDEHRWIVRIDSDEGRDPAMRQWTALAARFSYEHRDALKAARDAMVRRKAEVGSGPNDPAWTRMLHRAMEYVERGGWVDFEMLGIKVDGKLPPRPPAK